MKKLSLPEFRDYCNTHLFHSIIFATSNQSWKSFDSTMTIGYSFSRMIISFNPNVIYLKDKGNSMQFNRIKEVKLNEKKCALGTIFTLVCGNSSGNKTEDMEYTLVGQ